MRRLASVVSLMVLVAAACAPAAQPSTSTVTTATVVSTPVVSTTTTTTTERTTAPTSTTGPTTKVYVPPEVGPLAGLSWPGGRVPVGALLHDDGTRLWSITLDGERTAIWEHPAVEPLALAAGPDGARVARYELGTWTWVAPQDDTIPATEPPDCTAWEWTWP